LLERSIKQAKDLIESFLRYGMHKYDYLKLKM
jgi:hypothetical protein